jgi:hypothetical protein
MPLAFKSHMILRHEKPTSLKCEKDSIGYIWSLG